MAGPELTGRPCGCGVIQHPEEPAEIRVEPVRAELKGLTARQLGEAGRQVIGTGHPGPADQNGDDPDVARQGGLDLRRTKSPVLSMRRFPTASVIVSHRSPISASSTSQEPTAVVIT